jgi:hypothetical protein
LLALSQELPSSPSSPVGSLLVTGLSAAFAVDYLMRLALSGQRREFVRTHWLDLCAVILPMLQPLRLLRMVATLILVGRQARMASQIRLTTYVGGAVIGLLMFGSLPCCRWSGSRRAGTSGRWATRCGGRSRR